MEIPPLIKLLIAMKSSFGAENIPYASIQIVFSFALFSICFTVCLCRSAVRFSVSVPILGGCV